MKVKDTTKNARFFCGMEEISRERATELEALNDNILDLAMETKNISLLLGCKFITIIDRPQSYPLFAS